jgi:hypothetical protein
MANMASVAYAIEGPRESLEDILGAIIIGMDDAHHWTEWSACRKLGFSEEELDDKRLGGEISEEPEINEQGVLRFWAEERWGLQDFEALLRQKFRDIKVFWVVEESGDEVYCTNDKEGKYFPERYFCDTAQDDIYQSEYFKTEESMYNWLSKITNGRVKSKEDVDSFNADYEDSGADDENFIIIHEFEIIDESA